MDSRAKQRLTGAVILVAVFVLFVPELLTGPGKSAPAETPAEDGLRRYTIDLDAQSNPNQSSPTQANPEQVTPAASTLATPGEAASPEPATSGVAAADAKPASVPDQPAAEAVMTEPHEAKPVAQLPASKPPVTAAEPKPESSRPATPVEKGSFAVQLGSFGSRENAERLVREMTAKGFSAFIAPIASNGRELYRVRVGPARDRPQAEALAAQLRRIGQTGSVVPIS